MPKTFNTDVDAFGCELFNTIVGAYGDTVCRIYNYPKTDGSRCILVQTDDDVRIEINIRRIPEAEKQNFAEPKVS